MVSVCSAESGPASHVQALTVNAIIGWREEGPKRFLVHWQGYPEREATWEPEKGLPEYMVKAFKETMMAKTVSRATHRECQSAARLVLASQAPKTPPRAPKTKAPAKAANKAAKPKSKAPRVGSQPRLGIKARSTGRSNGHAVK